MKMQTQKETGSTIHLGSRIRMAPEEVKRLEFGLNYIRIWLSQSQQIFSSTFLSVIEKRMVNFKNFIRVNRQSIINLDLVVRIEGQICFLVNEQKLVLRGE